MNGPCGFLIRFTFVVWVLAGAGALALSGCKCGRSKPAGPAASASASGLSPELSSKVLARVGDETITLGDYAATLERMDRFERVRYQTPERREQLLQEMIHVRLLAAEARRQGLHEDPETRGRIRQALRDELLAEVRRAAPAPEDIPAKDVRAYYDDRRDDFFTPERRRLALIVTKQRSTAEQALQQAKGAEPAQWGELVAKYSVKQSDGDTPAELRGDVGFVTAPDDPRAEESEIADEVRRAGFQIAEQGNVHSTVVEADDQFYVVRLVTRVEAGQRSLEESERSIRVTLAQRAIRKAEERLIAQLREKYAVEIDQEALGEVEVPAAERE